MRTPYTEDRVATYKYVATKRCLFVYASTSTSRTTPMRLRHSLLIKVLLLVVAVSLMSGFAALAQPGRPNPTGFNPCFTKNQPHSAPSFFCCEPGKLAPSTPTKTFRPPPCAPPTCGLGYPDTAV